MRRLYRTGGFRGYFQTGLENRVIEGTAMGLLEDMQLFAQVVEKGGFSAAGRHARMSPALVSHRIAMLEERLGARLLNRTTRRMQLTSGGRAFHEHAVAVIEAAQRAEASVADAGGAPRGSLKVTAPLGLGRRVLGRTVTRFRALHPEVDIRVRLSEHLLDLVDEGVDVALRLARFSDSSLILRRVADIDRALCPPMWRRAALPRRRRNWCGTPACSCASPDRSSSAGRSAAAARSRRPGPSRATWTRTTAT
jgi:DNA-binding transcriptional LysR family regulator